jgi:SAM-dependent methyltransferase
MAQWYETLFANFGRTYDKECFTQGAVGEVDFVERELGGDRTKRVLDIACGTGRHAIELTKRGYQVVGFDLSEGQLRVAREKAQAAGVSVDFERRDATQPHFQQEFDAALMFCEGAFPLMETDEKNFAILQHAAAALRPGGKLMLTTLSALFPLFHSVKDFLNANSLDTDTVAASLPFDLMTFREQLDVTFTDDAGQSHTIHANQRYHTPPELTWLLKTAGFAKVDIFGGHLGEFSREHTLTTNDFEMLVVAEKGD